MWQIVNIAQHTYGFQPEHRRDEVWAATAFVQEQEADIQVNVDIHMYAISSDGEYEQLLEAVRYFADVIEQRNGKHVGSIQYTCKGVLANGVNVDVPVTTDKHGYKLVDTVFTEKR
ncbi:hypothetical protein [Paenibacillus sp. 481]|uniref:hypothetical protein n=1 Tax=Paenibacillus sp. 481 TaxID=2835869 RepID=UPI001E2987DE|nr:hypothetical protein [Paenibacillus sp. 481]UHA75510.1 hypothetical protein KIK04_11245 [Paenibacillus sp. 481]